MSEKVCLKCGSIVNIDYSKDKVFCTNCGNLVYEDTDNNGKIRFIRDNSYFYCAVSLDCYLNNNRVAVVNSSRDVVIPVDFGKYEFYCKYPTSMKSKKYEFTIDESNKKCAFYVYPGFMSPIVKVNREEEKQEKTKRTLLSVLLFVGIFLISFIIFFLIGLLFV